MENDLASRRASLNNCEHVTSVHGRADINIQRDYRSTLRRFHFVLHLHRFDYDYARAGFDLIADPDQHAHDFAGHGCDDAGRLVGVRDRAGSATEAFRIDERDRVFRGAYDDTNRLPHVRSAVNAAIKDLAVGNQHVTRNAGFADIESVAAAINLRMNAGTIILNQDIGLIIGDSGVQFHFFEDDVGCGVRSPRVSKGNCPISQLLPSIKLVAIFFMMSAWRSSPP